MNGLKRFILWDYPRAGWQYDIIVAVIVGFIFLTPRAWFRDQPKPSSIVMLPPEHGGSAGVFWLEPELLAGVPETQRLKADYRAPGADLRRRTGDSRLHGIHDKLNPPTDEGNIPPFFLPLDSPQLSGAC
jgi:hypothetical protein